MEQVTSLRRRSSVPKDFGRQSLELHTLSPADTERAELDVERSHIREMMEKDSTSDLVLRMFRVLQVRHIRSTAVTRGRTHLHTQMLLGPTVIALSVILLLRFTSLSNDCNNGIDDAGPNCLSYLHAVGALKFCVVPGVFGVIEGVVGMTATYSTSIPLWLPILVDNFTGGFYMGGGCVRTTTLSLGKRPLCRN